MRDACRLGAIAALAITGLHAGPAWSQVDMPDRQLILDHHVHLFSPDVAARLTTELKLDPPLKPSVLPTLLQAMDAAGVRGGTLFSTAYMFAKEGPNTPEALTRQRAENEWTAVQAARSAGRLVAFCSFNPLQDEAGEEIMWCRRSGRFAGYKLHFANSDVDLRDPTHIATLQSAFRCLRAQGLPIAVHLRTKRADYGRADAEAFVDKLLPELGDTPVQIAHAGGWGGYDPRTDDALAAFEPAIGAGRGRNLYFDLSAVIRPVRKRAEIAGAGWWPDNRYARLVERMRRLGLKRFLFGTDYPEWLPGAYREDLSRELPLSPTERATLFGNRAPWLDATVPPGEAGRPASGTCPAGPRARNRPPAG